MFKPEEAAPVADSREAVDLQVVEQDKVIDKLIADDLPMIETATTELRSLYDSQSKEARDKLLVNISALVSGSLRAYSKLSESGMSEAIRRAVIMGMIDKQLAG